MAYEISVNTGAIIVPIKDEFGEKIGEMKFIPSDVDILKRYQDVQKWFETVDVHDVDTSEKVVEISDKIKEQFDILFNAPVSQGLFGKCSPLTPLADGTIYCESVMKGVGDLFKETFKERMDSLHKVEEATKEYTK